MSIPVYEHTSLTGLYDYLNHHFYLAIDNTCTDATEQLVHLPADNNASSDYYTLATNFLDRVKAMMNHRRDTLGPYVQELYKKNVEKHDCSTCSGKCSFQHALQVANLKDWDNGLKETLYRLHISAPDISAEETNSAYHRFRELMMQLDVALTRLFYHEEALLVPYVLKAQNNIYANVH